MSCDLGEVTKSSENELCNEKQGPVLKNDVNVSLLLVLQ